jgi:hypothetical protein
MPFAAKSPRPGPVIETFDMLAEKPITLREAAGLIPVRSSGKRFAKQMIRPRIIRGARPEAAAGPDHRVRLQAAQIGKSLYTSTEAIRRFLERLTRPDQPTAEQRASRELTLHQLQVADFL